jgi:type II secretory ATPase GspE/PulE/Tfp pilus assembly ATPase PilB-like protein
MPVDRSKSLAEALLKLDAKSPRYAVEAVDLILDRSRAEGASDVHFQPTRDGLEIRRRIDGVLEPVAILPASIASNVVARLKILANLLTYKNDIPQEGRIRASQGDIEIRVSTFPTLFGERAATRLFPGSGRHARLADLGLPEDLSRAIERLLAETSGAIVLSGPSGSGKSTTIHACLREVISRSDNQHCLMSLEDPIEVAIEGVSQSQVDAAAGFDLATGLRSLLRQDPDVLAVGEIRDRTTAEITLEASLTGRLVLTTFHAGDASGAITRLLEMGIEPYLIRGGVLAIVSQRLVRSLCECAIDADPADPAVALGLNLKSARIAAGCDHCGGTGYRDRFPIAELLEPTDATIGRAILDRADRSAIERIAKEKGMITLWDRAVSAVESGATSAREIRRVLGFQGPPKIE